MLTFVIKPKRPMRFWWGARAIYHAPRTEVERRHRKTRTREIKAFIDILPDRHNWEGKTREEDPEAEGFCEWVNQIALPALQRWCDENLVSTSSAEVFSLDESGRHFEASPNSSYGYMCIGAWQLPDEEIRWYDDCPAKGNFYHLRGEMALVEAPADQFPIYEVAGKRGQWSGKQTLKIGDRVRITSNGLEAGTIRAFFTEDGYLGVEVVCDQRPDWHVKQNGSQHPTPLVFGNEVEKL